MGAVQALTPGGAQSSPAGVVLACDQAIFTSIRGPMGEGYRLVAASRGLRADEKQTITRNSPSHDALCLREESGVKDAPAAAFYSLPTGRLCVAYSCVAGAEHTARGGQRVYTHVAVFESRDFPDCGYNPFNVLRAMVAAGLTTPQLTPPAVLPGLVLSVANPGPGVSSANFISRWTSAHRRYCLHALIEHHPLVIDVKDGWVESAEALLLGVPGPSRAEVSFGAGVRFSVGRGHQLQILYDDKGTVRSRLAGQSVEYIQPTSKTPPSPPSSAWLTFVDRHWTSGDLPTLARRTSRAFEDTTRSARERMGTLFNDLDTVVQMTMASVISLAATRLRESSRGVEREIRDELLSTAQRAVRQGITAASWADIEPIWRPLLTLWRSSNEGTAFAHPLIEIVLRRLMIANPTQAAEAALDVVRDVPPTVDKSRHEALLDEVLTALLGAPAPSCDADRARSANLCTRWRAARPASATVARFCDRLATRQSTTPS